MIRVLFTLNLLLVGFVLGLLVQRARLEPPPVLYPAPVSAPKSGIWV